MMALGAHRVVCTVHRVCQHLDAGSVLTGISSPSQGRSARALVSTLLRGSRNRVAAWGVSMPRVYVTEHRQSPHLEAEAKPRMEEHQRTKTLTLKYASHLSSLVLL